MRLHDSDGCTYTHARSLHSTVKTSKRQYTRFPEKGKKIGRREEEQKRAHQPESVSTVDTLPREERRGGKEESFLPTFFSFFLPLERELVVGWCRRRPLVLAQLMCEKKNFSLTLLFPEELFSDPAFPFSLVGQPPPPPPFSLPPPRGTAAAKTNAPNPADGGGGDSRGWCGERGEGERK